MIACKTAAPFNCDRCHQELDHESVYRIDPQPNGTWPIERVTCDTTRPTSPSSETACSIVLRYPTTIILENPFGKSITTCGKPASATLEVVLRPRSQNLPPSGCCFRCLGWWFSTRSGEPGEIAPIDSVPTGRPTLCHSPAMKSPENDTLKQQTVLAPPGLWNQCQGDKSEHSS